MSFIVLWVTNENENFRIDEDILKTEKVSITIDDEQEIDDIVGEPIGICEMCGHHVGVRQKAHIMAEGKKTENNVLMLCPICHSMFDTHVKPKIFKAMMEGLSGDAQVMKEVYLRTGCGSVSEGVDEKTGDKIS